MSGTRSAVTGAFSYTGRYLTRRLLERAGSQVVNFTNHPERASGFTSSEASRITTLPLEFANEAALARGLEGCDVLYCTYWIRFARGDDTHERAAERLGRLFSIAKAVGIRKVVFSSHTRTSERSPFAYIAGKARVEATLRQTGLAYAIVRPCGIFGDSPVESILMNNAAYVMRRTPLFLLAGDGESRFQPVHVRDMAELMQTLGESADLAVEADACGPDAPTARELFSTIARVCGSRALVVAPGVPSRVVTMLTKPLDMLTGDVLLDTDDLDLMLTGLTVADNPADPAIARRQSLFSWLEAVGPELGKTYVSSIERYYK